jgi:hypothetical protein
MDVEAAHHGVRENHEEMPRIIAINGNRLDEVRMLIETGEHAVTYLKYPMSQIRLTRDGDVIGLSLPAYLSVELYRTGILPQNAKVPVEIAISGRSAGRYVVSDVRYPDSRTIPHGQVIFLLTRVPQPTVPDTGVQPPSRTKVAESRTYITDITHYLDETGEMAQMPGPARKLASFLTLLIEAATGAPAGSVHDSGIRCKAKGCRGSIRTSLAPAGDEISWQCPVCGQNGFIRNWQNTKWNQRKQSEGAE